VSAAVFDRLASQYDRLWTRSTVGLLQREAVWRHIGPLCKPGQAALDRAGQTALDRAGQAALDRAGQTALDHAGQTALDRAGQTALDHAGQTALDLGCGTGEDALRLMQHGVRVHAIDASPEMVRIARERGVDAHTLPIEHCGILNGSLDASLDGSFDIALSNFGALNCVEDLESLREPLARLVRPNGYLIVCVIGRFCLWETAWALLRRQPAKAFRRWRKSAMSSLGIRVYYPSSKRLEAAFHPRFTLVSWCGIGLSVPPSYVTGLPAGVLRILAAFDRRVAHWPLLRALADHRLFVFVRSSSCP
jgi:ubiquinone/menaquinone biosynthesis C-methylase UbiE